MAYRALRTKAIDLRKKGKTYTEIRRELKISKSTLSNWLSLYPLTRAQLVELEASIKRNKEYSREKYRETMRLKREKRLLETYTSMGNVLLPLSMKELEIAGLFLYWGEGQKRINSAVAISNTDPQVIRFGLYWLNQVLIIPVEKICVYLHLYSDMDIDMELEYWVKELNLPLAQFKKPYIKRSLRSTIDHKGFGHGTCNLVVNNVLLKEKIMMSIKSIADFYCPNVAIRL